MKPQAGSEVLANTREGETMGHWETVIYPNGDKGIRFVYDTPEEEAKAAADRKIDAAQALGDLEDDEREERR